jgi:uracil phosphoribosyltransferase
MMSVSFRASVHPLVLHKLSYLRQPRPYVSSRDYANLMRELGMLLAVEACADLPIEVLKAQPEGRVQQHPILDPFTTPYYPKDRYVLKHAARPVIISVVRSGLIMAEGVKEIVPTPYMGHIGVVVAPDEVAPFMITLPESTPGRTCLVVDPFIVGGTTALAVLNILIGFNIPASNIRFLTLCMARTGHERLRAAKEIAGVQFFCGRIDGMGDIAPDENWITDFDDLNGRLFRTINRNSGVFRQASGT